MKVTTLDQYPLPLGELVVFTTPDPEAGAVLSDVPASFNQGNHVNGAAQTGTWLAVAFDLPGALDLAALEQAFLALIARHGTLLSSFFRSPSGVQRLSHPQPTRLELRREPLPDDEDQRRDRLRAVLDEACRPTGYPSYLLAAINRDGEVETSTVICGFDHCHTDAYSLAMSLRDVHHLYLGFVAGRDTSGELPEVGSHVAACLEEVADVVPNDDPRIADWHAFFDGDEGGLPQFPVDLGVPIGTRHPQRVDVIDLLDEDQTGALERGCATHGVGVFAAVMAAAAQATADLGGGDRLRALIPVHTRRAPVWRDALGWFVTNGPIEAVAHPDFTDTLLDTAKRIRHAVEMSKVTLRQVVETYPGGLRHPRSSVFMVSYIDYRMLPGHAEHAAMNAHHLSASSDCDDLQVWFSRTEDGLAIRCRYPGTDQAINVLSRWQERVRTHLMSL